MRRNVYGLGSSHFDRHYFGNRYFFLFLQVLRCFSSLRTLRVIAVPGLQPGGFPHSDISGSIPVCKSPELFAAYHVLLHFRKPRHPPFALLLFLVLVNHMRLNVSYYSFCLMKLQSSQTRKNSNLLQTIISFLLYLVIFPNKSMNLSLMELPLSQSRITVYFKKTEDKHISALLFAPQ